MPFFAIGIDIFADVEYNSNKEGRRMDERNSLFDVRLEGVQIENFKNVKQGTVVLPNASNRKKPDILGLYGQNGSGKTALIDAISLLKCLLMGMSVPSQYADYINLDSDYEKILLISGVKNDIFIHVNGKSKKLLHPEDKVNGIHIMKKEEYKDYINNKYINKNNDKYFDIEEYNIKEK